MTSVVGGINRMPSTPCPRCSDRAAFSNKRGRYFCAECELEFDAPTQAVEPQTIFLSYAHRSEREEDFDVSEELVLLIQAELQRDGHTVWIDKEGIRAGSQWRERITAAILEHAHFLSFLSTRSVRDPGVCLNEIAIALGASKNIQTVLAQDERQVAPPLTISHVQWHDFQHWSDIRAGTKTGPIGEDWETWFAQRMVGVREALSSAQNTRVNGDLQKLRDILDPRSFEARIVEKTTNFHGRQWLFDAAQDWLDNSTSRMFWLKGSPGVGKSAFAAMLAHQARSAVIGFFMCDFQGRKDPEESAREAICTLAFQIASRLPDYRLKLLYQMQLEKDMINKRSADDLFEFLITEPLNRSGKIPESTRLCLVIDALDEAGRSNGGNALAELLAKHAARLPDWLGVLVTSRPEPYLEQMLKTLSGTAVDGQSSQNRQDLADWIDQRLPEELRGEERQQVIEAVLEKSGGTFLYLSLVETDKTLSLADPKGLPDKLDGFFKQTFNRYFPDPEAYGKKTEPFLRLMVAAPGPLPAEMGRQILGWSQRELTLNVIEPMGSLLQGSNGGVTFFHASLPDWLRDSGRSGSHVVEPIGARVLSEFLWKERGVSNSAWLPKINDWLPQLLADAECFEKLKNLMIDSNFPIVSAWTQLPRFPSDFSIDLLEDSFLSRAEAIWEQYREGRPDDLGVFADMFQAVYIFVSKRTENLFSRFVARNKNLPGLFRSGFSDTINSDVINSNKIAVYDYLNRAITKALKLGLEVTNECFSLRDELRTSCLWCGDWYPNGGYILNDPYGITHIWQRRGSIFRGQLVEGDAGFNTLSLLVEVCSSSPDKSLILHLIRGGANVFHDEGFESFSGGRSLYTRLFELNDPEISDSLSARGAPKKAL